MDREWQKAFTSGLAEVIFETVRLCARARNLRRLDCFFRGQQEALAALMEAYRGQSGAQIALRPSLGF